MQLVLSAPGDIEGLLQDVEKIKWRLWHRQVDRATSLISEIQCQVNALLEQSLWTFRFTKLLKKLKGYVLQNRTSIVDYSRRSRSGKRISTSLAESSVNSLVAKRFVKKQQMRWSRLGAHSSSKEANRNRKR